uniref:Uncharacterized protein n=1 Tax=Anguilla anguilla TaxID=7936 RepID=A0A0E9WHT3_ANGAN
MTRTGNPATNTHHFAKSTASITVPSLVFNTPSASASTASHENLMIHYYLLIACFLLSVQSVAVNSFSSVPICRELNLK